MPSAGLAASSEEMTSVLRDRGLLDDADIVGQGLIVSDHSSRHVNLLFDVGQQRGWFVKQPLAGDVFARKTLDRELSFHRWLEQHGRARRIAAYVPRLRMLLDEPLALVFEARLPSLSLVELAWQPESGPEFGGWASRLAELLIAVHQPFTSECQRPSWSSVEAPWVLGAACPRPSFFSFASSGAMQLVTLIQRARPLAKLLVELESEWRDAPARTLVHGDFKWRNVLAEGQKLSLVDWELATVGLAAWDIGAAFVSYLGFWIDSLVFDGDAKLSDLVAASNVKLGAVQKECRVLWNAYREGSDLRVGTANRLLSQSLRCAAARLVQEAAEYAAEQPKLPNASLLRLQLAVNLAENPDTRGFELFRIPRGLDL